MNGGKRIEMPQFVLAILPSRVCRVRVYRNRRVGAMTGQLRRRQQLHPNDNYILRAPSFCPSFRYILTVELCSGGIRTQL